MSLLQVKNLSIEFRSRESVFSAVKDLSFNLESGETLGIVGESGSGKSVTCYALLKLIAIPPGKITSGSILFDGIDLLQAGEKTIRSIRGKRISMIFQDAMTSLNPYLNIGNQLIEPLRLHSKPSVDKKTARSKATNLLQEVGIDHPEACMEQYPHQLSGGMQQRVMIAMALITEPDILIADEPTTALDVTTQKQILDLIQSVQQQRNLSVIFVSHDLNVVNHICDNVLVMHKGQLIEQGKTSTVLTTPQNDYTRTLIQAIPNSAKPDNFNTVTTNLDDPPLLAVKKLRICYHDKKQRKIAVNNLSLHLAKGEVLGLVGESGSGKSTLSQGIIRLVNLVDGEVFFENQRIDNIKRRSAPRLNKDIQIVFQDPYASLNPRMTAFNAIAEPLKLYNKYLSQQELTEQVEQLLHEVDLDKHWANKYPHEFSGGQRQRIAIARSLASKPKLIIADEPVSALDVTVQAQILALLLTLCQRHTMTMLFISHDLDVIRYVADRVAVMKAGEIVEIGDTEEIFNQPSHEYTCRLIAAKL